MWFGVTLGFGTLQHKTKAFLHISCVKVARSRGSAGVRVKWVWMRPCRGELESDTALGMAIGPWLSRAHGWHHWAVGSCNLALLVASMGQGLKA